MSAYVSLDHRDAIRAMLAPLEASPTEYQIYIGAITVSDDELEFPYIVVWAAPGHRDLINLTGNSLDLTTLTQLTVTGRDDTEAMAALDLAAGLLVGKKPTLDGRMPGFIRQINDEPIVTPVDDVHGPDGQPAYQAIAQFSVTSSAAPAA